MFDENTNYYWKSVVDWIVFYDFDPLKKKIPVAKKKKHETTKKNNIILHASEMYSKKIGKNWTLAVSRDRLLVFVDVGRSKFLADEGKKFT